MQRDYNRREYPGGQRKQRKTLGNAFVRVKGRLFGDWISEGTRNTGYSTTDFIEQPAYVIESIIRDEIHVERDLLWVGFNTTNNTIDLELFSGSNDYYNNAYLISVTSDWIKKVTDYDGTNHRITVASLTTADIDEVGTALDSGTTDSAATNKLIQSGQNFTTTVVVGALVKNTTDTTYAVVTAIDSDTQLSISSDIMANGENYTIYPRHHFYLSNVNCNVDEDSFDVVGAGAIFDSTTTSTTANKLIDSVGGFSGVVKVGMIAYNDTDSTQTTVTAVDSDTQLSVRDDIFTSGEDYRIYGKRHNWLFARSIDEEYNARNILDQLCYECHCVLLKSYNAYKLLALDADEPIATFSSPMTDNNGQILLTCHLTSLDNVYSDYTFLYAYENGKGDYIEKIFCNKNGSSISIILDDTYQQKCDDAETNYLIKRAITIPLTWIYARLSDFATNYTVSYFAQKIIRDFTLQRLVVNYTGNIKDHIQYEIGDLVKIDYSDMIPTGLNNSAVFMIMSKTISPNKFNPYVNFTLIQMIED
uniref:Tail protein n=1 Tax=viral metagenome TaxID=1070528 RepID=A0A6M3IKE6_9ZZZZ